MFVKQSPDAAVASNRLAVARTLGCEFDSFLYAPIDELNNEVPLSVLSALARQNLDPWAEAAALAQLTRASAIVRLTVVIAAVTAESPARREPAARAERLIDLLPRSVGFTMPRLNKLPSEVFGNVTPIIVYLIVGAMIFVSALLGY